MSLEDYRRKRDPARTPEPMPGDSPGPGADAPAGAADEVPAGADAGLFVVQEHHARSLHWDFRLEHEGVLVSWAVPKGIPDDPGRDHLAVHTEDHPLSYATFAGEIPRGEYGGGTVSIWDTGRYELVKREPGEVKVVLHGRRLSGGYTLYRTRDDQWMIHRERVAPPELIAPMMAVIAPLPSDDDAWAYEMKWDGVRAVAYLGGGRLRQLASRTGNDIIATYPELRALGAAAGTRQMVLDGEIVAFEGGRPSFEALQPRMHVTHPAQAAQLASRIPVTYLVFDLLHLDWRPTIGLPYQQRRELLDELGLAGASWQTPPSFTGVAGEDVLAAAAAQGLEGVVAKRLQSRYRPGARSADWRKVKTIFRQEAVVGGISPGKGNRAGKIGSLLIGVQGRAGLEYAGRVGTGLSAQSLALLDQRLMPLRRKTSPFVTPVPPDLVRNVIWVEPALVIEVAFTGWTGAGRMRAPSYQGIRSDKDPADVVREQ